jgi:hypothetical protein
MPGLLTHHYILYKTLDTYTSTSPLFNRILESNKKVTEHARKNEHKRYDTDEACALAGAAYVGSCGPDLFYLEFPGNGQFIADLMHYNKPSLFMIWCLRNIKKSLKALEKDLRSDLLMQLAYLLGHISHIGADITIHPYVNSIVQAYPDNPDVFKDSRGMNPKIMWKFHNLLEQYQDAYILHRRFIGLEKFGKDWENVNVARAAGLYYQKPAHTSEWFLLKNAKDFYKFTRTHASTLERDKYRFFTDDNWVIDVGNYYTGTMPSKDMMEKCPQLVQGGTYEKDGALQKPGLFDQYLTEAINRTISFWKEVEVYLAAPQTNFTDPQLAPEKKCFPTLRKHWNLDTGLALWADAATRDWMIPSEKNARLRIAGMLGYRTGHNNTKGDVQV